LPSTLSSAPSDAERSAPPSRRARLVVALIAIVVVAVIAVVTVVVVSGKDDPPSGSGPHEVPAANSAMVGEVAPDFAIKGLDGGTVRLSDYRGKPVVLNFWASWCTPCRQEFPLFRSASESSDGAYQMLGVDTGRDLRGDAQQFVGEQHALWPIGFDPDNQVARGYGVDPLPQTFFIRADGTIASHTIRALTKAELRHELAKIGVK
jgi:cytochrome c biogenesis protein CcmG/thiol:disulfide interchange protein DsbE